MKTGCRTGRGSAHEVGSPRHRNSDAILAAQAILAADAGDILTIATNNPRHLSRFPGIDAQPWQLITP
jgi:hypothetical protein